LQDYLCLLISDPFGSHILRVILNVLSGRPTEELARSNKSKNYHSKSGINEQLQTTTEKQDVRAVPKEFTVMLEKTIDRMVSTMSDLEARTFATHPIANPVVQVIRLLPVDLLFFADCCFGYSSLFDL
jgi:nucleolar protein 9